MKNNVWKLALVSAIILGFFACSSDDEEAPANKVNTAPTAENLTLSKATNVVFDEKIDAQVIANDIDNETLTYTWTTSGGTVEGTGNKVKWTAPKKVGTYTITCSISDGKESVQSSNTAEVVGSYFNPFDKGLSNWGFDDDVTNRTFSDGIMTVSCVDGASGSTYSYNASLTLPYSIKTKVAVNATDYNNIGVNATNFFFRFSAASTTPYLSNIQFQIAPGSKAWNIIANISDGTKSLLKRVSPVDVFTANDQFHIIGMSITTNKMLLANIDGVEVAQIDLSTYNTDFNFRKFSYATSSGLSLLVDDFYLTNDDTILK